jgi:WD40 repeat protein
MAFDLKAGIVRILAADGTTTTGTGFILSEKGIIATCSHVIQAEKLQVRSYPKPEKVEVIFRANGQRGAARLLPQAWRAAEAEDVALLQLEGPLPLEVVPLSIGSSEGSAGHDFQTFGFPDQSPDEGIYGEGWLLDQTTILGMRVLQVKSSEITPGFSGAPVFDMQTRRVVGMVTSIAAPDKFGRLAETAFITPAETLISIYPDLVPSDVRPYMGLSPFTEKDAEFFFGRRRLVEGLEEAMRSRPRFLLVMGPSGSGKSSVVQAGLIPRLRRGSVPGSDRWGIIMVLPADRPFDLLERSGLWGAYAGLADAARGWLNRSQGQEKLLLILDQFEEFLVTCPPEVRRKFWSRLEDLLDSDIEVSVLAVMRDDFYSRFADDAPSSVLQWTQRGFFQVGSNLEYEELREIIQQPARKVGLRLEEGLTEVIINDVLESSREGSARAGRSTVLPLLEFALTQLWERRDQGLLTHQAYQAIGKVTGSLTAWADQVCRSLEREGLGPLTRRILTDLVNLADESEGLPNSSRQRRLTDLFFDETKKDSVQRIVQKLADARLVATSLDKGEETVQIIHDFLIREWTLLQQWLKEDNSFLKWKRELEKDAREWRETSPNEISERDEGSLRRGQRLDESEEWLSERGSDLSEAEREFIFASQNLRKKEKDKEEKTRAYKERIRRRIIQGLALFSIIALALAGFAYLQMEKANDKTEEAMARSLASQSEQMMGITGSLTESVLLAIESLRHQETLEGEIALRRSLALLPKSIAKLQHSGSANAVVFSPDGRTMATASDDKTARIWDAETGNELQRLEHNDSVNAVTFSPDGRNIATASDDRTARLWNVETGRELQRLEHNDSVNAVVFSPDGRNIATASDDKTARLWNAETGRELHRLEHDSSMNALAFSPDADGQKIATASDDRTVRLWNVETGKELQRLEHDGWVWALAFSPDGKKMTAACSDGTARLWDVETGKELQRLDHDSSIYSVTFSPDGRNIATASDDKTARLWSVETGRELQRLKHDGSVNAVAFSSYGRKMATASSDGTARLWDVKTGKELQRLEHDGSVNAVAFSPDGRKMATASDDRTVRLWDVETDKGQQNLEHDGSVNAVAFSPDGQEIATASDDKTARLWDIGTGKVLQRLEHKGWVWTLAFSPDGKKMATATASDDKMTRLWDVEARKELPSLVHDSLVNAVAFSPDGQKIATASDDNMARLWDVEAGKELRSLEHDNSVNAVAFSPDGQKIATASDDNTTRLWNIKTGKELQSLEHDGSVNAVAFSPDGQEIATASDDKTARLWDIETRKELQSLEHDDSVNAVIFSPDGQEIATASDDKTARLWDVETGKELQSLEHDDSVNAVAFSPDGRKIATASSDRTARIWMLDIGEVMEMACNQLTKNMTRSEWKRFIKDPDSDCLICPAEGRFNRSSVWPGIRKQCQPCIGNIG